MLTSEQKQDINVGPSTDRERLNFLKLNILKIIGAVLAPEEAKI